MIDPQRLEAEVRWEWVAEVGEVFPHVMGVIRGQEIMAVSTSSLGPGRPKVQWC